MVWNQHNFKSCTKLISFHIALILFTKVWIQLSSLQLSVNNVGSLALIKQPVKEKENPEIKLIILRLKMTLCHILSLKRFVKYKEI